MLQKHLRNINKCIMLFKNINTESEILILCCINVAVMYFLMQYYCNTFATLQCCMGILTVVKMLSKYRQCNSRFKDQTV